MTSEWQQKRFGECAVLVRETVSPEELLSTNYVGLEHIGEGSLALIGHGVTGDVTSAKSRFRRGDILFGKLRPYFRKVVRAPFDGVCSTDIWVVRPRDNIDPGYLFYWMASEEFVDAATQGSDGTKMPRARWEYVSQFTALVPSFHEQRAIAHILGTLDDKIELNRRMNETLEAMARALFKSWFIDFDPVHAKAEGRDSGLPADIAAFFPDSFEDSDLGEIPKGWKVDTVGEHMNNFDSKRIPVSGAERAKRQGPYPYHGAAGVMDYVDDYLFDGIYLLVGEDGSVMQDNGVAVTQYVWGKMWVNNHAHVIQGNGMVSTEQLYLYFHVQPVRPYVTGAVQPKLSQGRMNMMPFLFAGDRICNAFSEEVRAWFAKYRSNVNESETLVALRDALLPKLMSGELTGNGVSQPVGAYQ